MSTVQQHVHDDLAPAGNRAADADPMGRIPALLRMLGAGALIIAMYTFLVRGWDNGDDLFRYLLMLGHTGILAAIGMASGHWLKESKGARLLLTLAVASVPVNFAILGAFIFSQNPLVDPAHFPRFVAWSMDSLPAALLTTGGSLLVLVPVTVLGFTVLARSMSRTLSLLFLASNAALLLPVRDPQIIGIVVLGLLLATFIFNRKAASGTSAATTQEGITALSLQFLPLAILMGRSLWLYSAEMFLLATLAIAMFFTLRQIGEFLSQQPMWRNALEIVSLAPAIAVAYFMAGTLSGMPFVPDALVIPGGALVSAALIYELSGRSEHMAEMFRMTAVGVLLFGMMVNLAIYTGPFAALACIAVGLALVYHGFKAQQGSVFVGGLVLMITGLVYQFYELFHHFNLGGWATLAALGIVSIVIASTIESQGGKLKPRITAWRTRFAQWEK